MQEIQNVQRRSSLTVTPQALAWDGKWMWLSSRDLGMLYKVDSANWEITYEVDPPGVIWADLYE